MKPRSTLTHAVFPAFIIALLTASMTLGSIWWYEAKEQHRLRDTLIDQTLSAAEVFYRQEHAATNDWGKRWVQP